MPAIVFKNHSLPLSSSTLLAFTIRLILSSSLSILYIFSYPLYPSFLSSLSPSFYPVPSSLYFAFTLPLLSFLHFLSMTPGVWSNYAISGSVWGAWRWRYSYCHRKRQWTKTIPVRSRYNNKYILTLIWSCQRSESLVSKHDVCDVTHAVCYVTHALLCIKSHGHQH